MPAPKGNSNAQYHGLRMRDVPPGFDYVRRTVSGLRGSLSDQVREAHGEITQLHAKLILDFCRHERRCILYAGWLREANEAEQDGLEGKEPRRHQLRLKRLQPLSLMEMVTIEEKIGAATEASTRALAKLGLDRYERDAWSVVHATVINSTPLPDAPSEPREVQP